MAEMEKVSFARILLYGFLTYSAIFMLWAGLAAYNHAYGWSAQGASYLLTAIVVFAAARHIGITSIKAGILYGIGWTIMHMALDLIYVIPAAGFVAIFTKFGLIGYGMVLIVPSVAAMYDNYMQKKVTATPHVG